MTSDVCEFCGTAGDTRLMWSDEHGRKVRVCRSLAACFDRVTAPIRALEGVCSCGKPFPQDGGAEGVCECCSGCAGGMHRETCATTYGMDCDLSCAAGGAS